MKMPQYFEPLHSAQTSKPLAINHIQPISRDTWRNGLAPPVIFLMASRDHAHEVNILASPVAEDFMFSTRPLQSCQVHSRVLIVGRDAGIAEFHACMWNNKTPLQPTLICVKQPGLARSAIELPDPKGQFLF